MHGCASSLVDHLFHVYRMFFSFRPSLNTWLPFQQVHQLEGVQEIGQFSLLLPEGPKNRRYLESHSKNRRSIYKEQCRYVPSLVEINRYPVHLQQVHCNRTTNKFKESTIKRFKAFLQSSEILITFLLHF